MSMNHQNKRVLVAMSGGVDSAVAAWRLQQQGYDCIGVTLKLYDGGDTLCEKSCCAFTDTSDARRVADRLGMPHYVLNFTGLFDTQVIRRFAEGYRNGLTPNPCIDCNRYIKFDALWQRADELGAAYLATGHYARVALSPDGQPVLMKGLDPHKDQSYVLYPLTRTRLARTLFPLGGLLKSEVRDIARAQHFENAEKHESQDICFVPDGNHAAFIERYTGTVAAPGDFIDREGRALGRHQGLTRYTVGQRKGLGLALQKPAYVLAKNVRDNTVVLGGDSDLYAKALRVGDFNWLSRAHTDDPFRAMAKIRYRQTAQWATVTPLTPGEVHIVFDEPQRAAAAGQAAVLYDGDIVVGGGTILYTDMQKDVPPRSP